MKLSKVFSGFFAGLGTVLMVGTVLVCLLCRDLEPKAASVPLGAQACGEQLARALSEGDYAAAGSLMYGEPDLGVDPASMGEAARLAWEAFQERLNVQFSGDCYMEGTEIYRDAAITVLDIPGAVAAVPELTQTLLSQVNAGEAEDGAYEDGVYLEAVADAVIRDALRTALEAGETKEYTTKLRFVQEEGIWRALPDKALLAAISGGLG